MNTAVRVDDLQKALLARAKALADEYLARAKRDRERLVAEAAERQRLRESREDGAARALAERAYRQIVQASEIEMREELDRARWVHVQAVIDALKERLEKIVADEQRYLPLLKGYLANAAQAIESDRLIAELSSKDYARFSARWDALAREAFPGKQITLSPETRASIGGVRVTSDDNRIRVDNSFEGRMERLEVELERVITERLFAGAATMGALFNG
jgi:V/A-type H+/Na+-transporting ATPase subunit E